MLVGSNDISVTSTAQADTKASRATQNVNSRSQGGNGGSQDDARTKS